MNCYCCWSPKGKDKGSPPADVQVKSGYSDEEKLGIAIAVLIEQGKNDLVGWVCSVSNFLSFGFDVGLLGVGQIQVYSTIVIWILSLLRPLARLFSLSETPGREIFG